MDLFLIAAIAKDGAIGQGGGLPWPRLDRDMWWFENLTTREYPLGFAQEVVGPMRLNYSVRRVRTNALLMGRRTYQSLPGKLPHRRTIVLTNSLVGKGFGILEDNSLADLYVNDLQEALRLAEVFGCGNTFIAGGTEVFAKALQIPALRTMFITEIDEEFPEADTWFPGALRLTSWDTVTYWDLGRYGLTDVWTRTMEGPWQCQEGIRFRFTIWSRDHATQ